MRTLGNRVVLVRTGTRRTSEDAMEVMCSGQLYVDLAWIGFFNTLPGNEGSNRISAGMNESVPCRLLYLTGNDSDSYAVLKRISPVRSSSMDVKSSIVKIAKWPGSKVKNGTSLRGSQPVRDDPRLREVMSRPESKKPSGFQIESRRTSRPCSVVLYVSTDTTTGLGLLKLKERDRASLTPRRPKSTLSPSSSAVTTSLPW
mmetsp:Transcript_11308/g.25716  ORF Transcript_11308/g.25716 Transcript_11308/m.25716 type:complete len:201 (-) Transcript_11308:1565-2167(-)